MFSISGQKANTTFWRCSRERKGRIQKVLDLRKKKAEEPKLTPKPHVFMTNKMGKKRREEIGNAFGSK